MMAPENDIPGPQVHQVELLGEITLTEEETRHLDQQLGQFISARRE